MTFPIVTGRRQKCRCGRQNPVVVFRFTAADVELAVCERCDGLRPKPGLGRTKK